MLDAGNLSVTTANMRAQLSLQPKTDAERSCPPLAAQDRRGAKLPAPSDDIWLCYKFGSTAGGSTALWAEPSHDVLRDEVSAHGCPTEQMIAEVAFRVERG